LNDGNLCHYKEGGRIDREHSDGRTLKDATGRREWGDSEKQNLGRWAQSARLGCPGERAKVAHETQRGIDSDKVENRQRRSNPEGLSRAPKEGGGGWWSDMGKEKLSSPMQTEEKTMKRVEDISPGKGNYEHVN